MLADILQTIHSLMTWRRLSEYSCAWRLTDEFLETSGCDTLIISVGRNVHCWSDVNMRLVHFQEISAELVEQQQFADGNLMLLWASAPAALTSRNNLRLNNLFSGFLFFISLGTMLVIL